MAGTGNGPPVELDPTGAGGLGLEDPGATDVFVDPIEDPIYGDGPGPGAGPPVDPLPPRTPSPALSARGGQPPQYNRHNFAPAYSLSDAIRDMNGAQGFSEDKAAIGTITRDLYLQVTPGCVPPENFAIGTDPFVGPASPRGSNAYNQAVLLFLWANYHAIAESAARVRREDAMFLAFLRLNVVMAGGVCRSLTNRALYVDEYNIATTTLAQVDFTQLHFAQESIEFISDIWLQLIALLRHVFITRGHHYKQEYKEMIDRTWAATTITPPQNLTLPAWDILFRAGLHCFGIRALHELTVWGKQSGKLAKSFVTRFDAAPAGTAPTRTGWAALSSMMRAPWWNDFYSVYKPAVDALRAANAKAESLGLRGHVNAKLFDWTYQHVEIGDKEITVLAPLVLGFLDTLEDTEAIKNQRAITKRGEGGAAIRQAFSTVLTIEARNARHMESVKQFLLQITKPNAASASRAT